MTSREQSLQPEPPQHGAVTDDSVTVSLSLPGFLTVPPLEVGTGVSVVTGINNVGKSRLLRRLHDLRAIDQPYALGEVDITVRAGGETGALRVRPSQDGEVARWTVTRAADVVWDDAISRTGNGPQYARRSRLPAFASSQPQVWNGPGFPSLAWICGGRPVYLNPLRALTMVDAQRVIPDSTATTRTTEVNANGSNLGQLLYTHLNDRTAAFRELEQVMAQLFPEVTGILTVPIERANSVRLTIRDRFSKRDVSIAECGTGVTQLLYFVAAVLMASPGRIFLVDEPHVYLHAQAERALALFLRTHPEHSYVVATHSPVFIDAIDPDRLWHLTRDEHGTAVRGVLPHDPGPRRDMFRALGWRPSQFAWAERVLFVEGESDALIYPIWFARWGWPSDVVRCPVVILGGAGGRLGAQRIAGQVSQYLSLDACVLLDGDQQGSSSATPCLYLPEPDLEAVLLRDLAAVRDVLLECRGQTTGESLDDLREQWPAPRLEAVLQEEPSANGARRISRLAQAMGVTFKKTLHGPLVAERMHMGKLDDIRDLLQPFVTGHAGCVG